jgi:hypothetical protein
MISKRSVKCFVVNRAEIQKVKLILDGKANLSVFFQTQFLG